MPSPATAPRAPRRLIAVLAGAMVLAACGKGKEDRKPPTPEAGFIVAKAESVPLFTELSGRTTAFEVSQVRPQVTGVITRRLFTEGALVRQGQTLYQIDPRLYRAAQNQAAANLQSAQALAVAANERAQRLRPLAQAEAVAKQDLTDAVATARQAEATIAQNRALLENARINLAFTNVPAPISGRIGRSIATTGALVTAGQVDALTTIQRLDPIFVDMQQSSADLLQLRRQAGAGGAATVRLKLEDGSDYGLSGTVQFAEAVVDPNTGSVTLRARFPNPRGLLLPGMYVRATLQQQTAQGAFLIPQQGVSRTPKGDATVLLVGPGNKAVQRDVVAQYTVGDKWLVTAGLKPGDRVITEGLNRVKPNQPIRPVPAGSRPKPVPAGPGGGAGGSGGGGGGAPGAGGSR